MISTFMFSSARRLQVLSEAMLVLNEAIRAMVNAGELLFMVEVFVVEVLERLVTLVVRRVTHATATRLSAAL